MLDCSLLKDITDFDIHLKRTVDLVEQLYRQNTVTPQMEEISANIFSGRRRVQHLSITHTAVSPALSEVPPDACDPLQSPDPVTPAYPTSRWGSVVAGQAAPADWGSWFQGVWL